MIIDAVRQQDVRVQRQMLTGLQRAALWQRLQRRAWAKLMKGTMPQMQCVWENQDGSVTSGYFWD